MAEPAVARALDPGPLTYDRLVVGACIGTTRLAVDDTMLEAWQRLYGRHPADGPLPLAFAPMLAMRAFLTIVAPRPPGNLHVGQSYRVKCMPWPHRPMLATVRCSAKELRKTRRIISFAVDLADADGGEALLSGTSTMFWAA